MKNSSKRIQKKIPLTTGVKLPRDYPWKVLSYIVTDLSTCFAEDDLELLSTIIRNRDRYSLALLREDWSLQCINSSCTSLLEIKAKYTVTSLLKKYQFPADVEKCRSTAIGKFLAAENQCKTFNEKGYLSLIDNSLPWVAEFFTYAQQFIQKVLGTVLPSSKKLTEWSRHGPGANLDTCDGLVDQYHKFSTWPYSCTIDAYRYARFVIETDQRWFGSLLSSYRDRYKIPQHYPIDMRLFWTRVLKVVDGDRICFVPKDAETLRSIAIMPAMNLYLQLGVDGYPKTFKTLRCRPRLSVEESEPGLSGIYS